MKKQIFIVKHGSYQFDVMVCIGSSHEEVCKAIEKNGCKLSEKEKEELYMEGDGRTVILSSGQTIIRLDTLKNKSLFYSALSHEIFHAVEFLFDRVGIKYDIEKSGEAFAYQIGHLTRQIVEKLR